MKLANLKSIPKTVFLNKDGEIPAIDKSAPYAVIKLGEIWNKGEKEEQAIDTLSMLRVPPKIRSSGQGIAMFSAVLKWMKKNKIPYLVFDNYESGFWDNVALKYPGVLTFSKSKRFGLISLDSTIKIQHIL